MMLWTEKEIAAIVIKLLNDFIVEKRELIKRDPDYNLKDYVRDVLCNNNDWNNHFSDVDSTYEMVNNIIYEMHRNGLSNILTQYGGSPNSDNITKEVVGYFKIIFEILMKC